MDKLDGGAANSHSLLDELHQRRVARASPEEVNARFLYPDPNNASLAEIRVRAWQADHLDRKVLVNVQEERKPSQAQAIGADVRDPAHQLTPVRAAHGRRDVDGKTFVGTTRLRQVSVLSLK